MALNNTYYSYAFLTYILLILNSNTSFSYLAYHPTKYGNRYNSQTTNNLLKPARGTTTTSSSHYASSFISPPQSPSISPIIKDEEAINFNKDFISDDEDDTKEDLDNLSIDEIKSLLLTMLQKSTIMKKDLSYISDLVNILEQKYAPVQTLEFLNFAMGGNWELVSILYL